MKHRYMEGLILVVGIMFQSIILTTEKQSVWMKTLISMIISSINMLHIILIMLAKLL